MTIRILVVDDHDIVRSGLVALLQRDPEFEVVGEAGDGLQALQLAQALQPDVMVTDLSMPKLNGIELVRRMQAEQAQVKLLCLSYHEASHMVLSAIDAGAQGYVLKHSTVQELVEAVRQVARGKVFVSASLVGVFVAGFRARHSAQPCSAYAALTAREREVAQLLSEGHSTAEVAEQLHVSVKTVATHRENIFQKLRLGGIAELTRYALREGLSSLDAPCRALRAG